MQPATSDTMRKLMRLVVTDGFGKQAEVAGYYPGGKTGTAEKVGKHGYKRGFKENFNVAAFTSVFPMNAPRYAVYMMLDEPHGNKSTYGYATAGWVAAPAAGRVIARIGPMLGMLPDIAGRAGDQSGAVHPAAAGAGRPASRARHRRRSARRQARRPRPALTVPATPARAGAPDRPRSAPRGTTRRRRRAVAAAAIARRRGRPRCGSLTSCARFPSRRWPHPLPGGMRARWTLPASPPTAGGCAPGYLFAALPGSRADGRAFIAEAVARGAAAVLAPRAPPGRRACRRARCWRTPSRAAASPSSPPAWPARSRAIVVAVTGTNGKTSTVEFLRQLWAAGGKPAASLGTLGLIARASTPVPA